MLSCYRVLDLTDEKGFICAKTLGDLGADVIKVERPGGDPSRNKGPFYHDIPDPEKSLYWFAFNASKRGITLDIETADGREIFKRLAKTADVVVESFPPGYMDDIGLGYDVLSQVNPGLIMTSITGYGQEGPYKDYNDQDIALWALSGFMYIAGEPDRPPLAPSYHHSHLLGAMNGAVGTMVALCHRRLTGHGEQVDASTHQSLCFATSVELKVPWAMLKLIPTRLGRNRAHVTCQDGATDLPLLWECKDGSIAFEFGFGATWIPSNAGILEWIKRDGIDPGVLGRIDWSKDWTYCTIKDTEEIVTVLRKFFKKYTKKELYEGAMKNRIQLTPLLTPEDQVQFPHLIARNFWIDVEHPELGTKITYPGGFVKPGIGDCRIRRRAPLIGEHNDEIYKKELGMSTEELVALKERRVI